MIRPNHLAWHPLAQYLFPSRRRHQQDGVTAWVIQPRWRRHAHHMAWYALRTRKPRIPIPSRRIFHPRFPSPPDTAEPSRTHFRTRTWGNQHQVESIYAFLSPSFSQFDARQMKDLGLGMLRCGQKGHCHGSAGSSTISPLSQPSHRWKSGSSKPRSGGGGRSFRRDG